MSNKNKKDANKTEIQVFVFREKHVRTLEIDGNPWFVAKDVAEILDYRNAPDMTRMLAEDEKGTHNVRILQKYSNNEKPDGNRHEVTIINESGLYRAIFASRKPEAEQFRLWVFREVLPQIRKTGMYVPAEIKEKLDGVVDSIKGIVDSVNALEKRLAALEEKQEKPLNKEWFSSGAQQVRLWAKERLEFDYKNNNLKTPSHELYADYILWCSEKIPDYEPLGVRAFTSSVKKLFPVRETRSFHGFPQPTWVFLNVRLKNGNPLLTD